MSRRTSFASFAASSTTFAFGISALTGLALAGPAASSGSGSVPPRAHGAEQALAALAPHLELHRLEGPRCRPVIGKLEEHRATTGCKAPATTCFFGEVHGLGLTASTYFHAETAVQGPSTSPGWVAYSGAFEYTTPRGSLKLRETGVSNPTTGNPESGAITAHQKVLEGTGEWAGATGYLFVSGFNIAGHVETTVLGELCTP